MKIKAKRKRTRLDKALRVINLAFSAVVTAYTIYTLIPKDESLPEAQAEAIVKGHMQSGGAER